MNTLTTAAPTRVLAASLLVAALAHVPPTGHHMAETPWLGAAFVAFTTACLGLLLALASRPAPVVYAATALLSAAAVAAYVTTRLVALPGTAHDVGAWLDPYGVTAVAAETFAAVTALRLLRAGRS